MGAVHVLIAAQPVAERAKCSPSVLNAQLTSVLQTLNSAKRAIRRLGLHIEGEQLPLGLPDTRPEILLHPKQDVTQLLQQSRGRWWKNEGGRRVAHTVFMGVTVSWEES